MTVSSPCSLKVWLTAGAAALGNLLEMQILRHLKLIESETLGPAAPVLTGPLGDADSHFSLRTTVLP